MTNDPVSLVDLQQGYVAYKTEIDAAAKRVLDSGWYILGREVAAFEESFAKWCGTSHAIGVGNGTDAIVLALRASGVGPGHAVFTVSHTAVATVAAVEMTGAMPVLVDVDPETYTLDPASLKSALEFHARTGTGGAPKAVVAVHLYGHPCDIGAIREICDSHGLYLIEDCAQAHGAVYEGKRVGTFGDLATFSFYPTKNLGAFGDGGAVVTSDAKLAETCRALRQYGWFEHYHSDVPGINSRLDEIHAAMLSVKLRYLDKEISARRRIAQSYDAALAQAVIVPKIRGGSEHAYHLYVIRTKNRDDLARLLKERGIATAIHYPAPVHRQKAYAGRVPLAPGGLPVTDRLSAEILSLPMHPFLTPEQQGRVAAATTEWVLAR